MSQSETETSDIIDVFYWLIDDRNVFERFTILRCILTWNPHQFPVNILAKRLPLTLLNDLRKTLVLDVFTANQNQALKIKIPTGGMCFFFLFILWLLILPRASVIDYVFFCWESHEIYPHQEKCPVVWSHLVNALRTSAVSMTTRDTGGGSHSYHRKIWSMTACPKLTPYSLY